MCISQQDRHLCVNGQVHCITSDRLIYSMQKAPLEPRRHSTRKGWAWRFCLMLLPSTKPKARASSSNMRTPLPSAPGHLGCAQGSRCAPPAPPATLPKRPSRQWARPAPSLSLSPAPLAVAPLPLQPRCGAQATPGAAAAAPLSHGSSTATRCSPPPPAGCSPEAPPAQQLMSRMVGGASRAAARR